MVENTLYHSNNHLYPSGQSHPNSAGLYPHTAGNGAPYRVQVAPQYRALGAPGAAVQPPAHGSAMYMGQITTIQNANSLVT